MRRVELADGAGGRLEVTCLAATEIHAPTGGMPIDWCLLTNREGDSLEAAVELVDWYRVLGSRGAVFWC